MVTVVPELDARETVRAVEERLRDVRAGLTDAWARAGGRRADVLGEQDLPWLIDHAARGGKLIRPQMVHWGWVAAGAPEQARDDVVTLGAAVEILHLFALIHDDIMDRSETRRGVPSTHTLAATAHARAGGRGDARTFGDAVAILAGDLLLAEAGHLVAGMPSPVRDAWRTMVVELVLGQRRDLTGAAAGRRDLTQALEVARLKSGAYTVAGPLRMGALLGGAPAAVVDALARYAFHVGEAFGLRDDILGVWGNPETTGKSADDDLAAGKATVLLALADGRLSPRGRNLLARAGALSPAELDALRAEMAGCGIRDDVEEMIAREVSRACAALEAALLGEQAVTGLTDLVHRIAWRHA